MDARARQRLPAREPTEFERRVYAVVRAIPRGRVSTYKLVALAAGCASCRAVGQALRRNPDWPTVPCHRVIASDLTLGGFRGAGSGALAAEKERLLAAEGVSFRNGRLVDGDSRVICPSGRRRAPHSVAPR